MIVVATDGYCAPSPGGRATWAFLARDAGGAELARGSGVAADDGGTSLLAEWRAAYEALQWLDVHSSALPEGDVEFRNDNASVVRALARDSPVPAKGEPRRLAQECRRLTRAIEAAGRRVTFTRVPRWENAEADALAHEAWRRAEGAGAGD